MGSGAAIQLTFAVASIKVPADNVGRNTGWQALVQLGGPTISLGIINTVFLNKAPEAVTHLLPDLSRAEIGAIITHPSSGLLRGLRPLVQEQVVDAVVGAKSSAYILCLVAGCLLLKIFRFKVNDCSWD